MIIMGNRQDELVLWKEMKAKSGYKTYSISSAPGISTIAFWVAQQVLAGKKVPNMINVPLLAIQENTLDAWLAATPVGTAATPALHAGRHGRADRRQSRGKEGRRPAATEAAAIADERCSSMGDGREAGSASLLVLRGLSKSFGPVEALRQVDLELRRGEFLGLIGHNGAGKTTLMNILMGVVHPDQRRFPARGRGHNRAL